MTKHKPRPRPRTKALAPGVSQLTSGSSALVRARVPGEYDLVNQQQLGLGGQLATPLPRDPRDLGPFGPAHPLYPDPIGQVRPDTGQQEPWVYEYPVAWNLPGGGDNRFIPWQTLRDAADQIDIFRRCIELRKDHIAGLKWAFTITPAAINQAYEADQRIGKSDLASQLRQQWAPDIGRLTAFWSNPWKSNGVDFRRWVRGVMEERLVLDATVVYPETTYGGDVLAMNLIDGSTIKPLLDARGARPVPPFPAFQQLLYGFPRGEYHADATTDDAGQQVLNGAYTAGALSYSRENFRTWTPYGQSPVEQALAAARVYMRRQGWMLSEYDDGVLPEMLIRVPETTQITPLERRRYEDALNDELAGQTAARHRGKILFPGMEPTLLPSVDERYKPDYDLFLIKRMASFFGVSMTSLGFSESKGLGSAGMHEAQADSEEIASIEPDKEAISSLINDLSRAFLRMPGEIMFTFVNDEGDDTLEGEQAENLKLARGSITVNDDRRRLGMPVYEFPEADMPYIQGAAGPVFLEGSFQRQQDNAAATQAALQAKATPAEDGDDPQAVDEDGDDEATTAAKSVELSAYRRYARRSRPRPFDWKFHRPDEVETILKAGGADPKDQAPPPAQPDNRWPAWAVDSALAALIASRISRAMTRGLDTRALAEAFLAWAAPQAGLTAAAVRAWLTARGVTAVAELGPVIREALAEAYAVGILAARAVLAHGDARAAAGLTVEVDWRGWTPGNARAARVVLGEEASVPGLQQLLDTAGQTLAGIDAFRLDLIATALADGLERGAGPRELGVALEGVLSDPERALTVAWTETNRAMSAASLATYRSRGTAGKSWLTAHDQRVCPICRANEDQGTISIGSTFASGEQAPPGHPRCRCAILPERLEATHG